MALLGFVLCRKQAPLKRWISVRWKLGVLVQCVISPLGTLSEMPPPPHCTEWRPVPAFLCSAQAREVTKWKGCGCQAESLPGAARTGSGEPPPPRHVPYKKNVPFVFHSAVAGNQRRHWYRCCAQNPCSRPASPVLLKHWVAFFSVSLQH